MTKCEHRNWITNIENSAAAVESQLGSAVVNSVFERYGAHSVALSSTLHTFMSRSRKQK